MTARWLVTAPGTGSPKNLIVTIVTSNFEIFESRTIWLADQDKKRQFFGFILSIETSNLLCKQMPAPSLIYLMCKLVNVRFNRTGNMGGKNCKQF